MDTGHLSEPVTTEGNGGALHSGGLCRAPLSVVSTESTPVIAQQSSVRAAPGASFTLPACARMAVWAPVVRESLPAKEQPLGVGGQAGVH